MRLTKRELKNLIEGILLEQEELSTLADDEDEQKDLGDQPSFKPIKFFIPNKILSKIVDNPEEIDKESETEIKIYAGNKDQLVYDVNDVPKSGVTGDQAETIIGFGLIYGVDENGDEDSVKLKLKRILDLDKNFEGKSLKRAIEIFDQKIKIGRLNFEKGKVKKALDL